MLFLDKDDWYGREIILNSTETKIKCFLISLYMSYENPYNSQNFPDKEWEIVIAQMKGMLRSLKFDWSVQ